MHVNTRTFSWQQAAMDRNGKRNGLVCHSFNLTPFSWLSRFHDVQPMYTVRVRVHVHVHVHVRVRVPLCVCVSHCVIP